MDGLCFFFFVFSSYFVLVGEILVLEMMMETLANVQNPVIVQVLVAQRSKQ